MGSRIPYGYDIVGGKAVINEAEANRLKLYYRRYLEGWSMSAAAQEAGLPFSSSTYKNLFKRKEYIGTDYYPPIITAEYQETLISEWESRKGEAPRQSKPCPKKGVRIYTDFKSARMRAYAPDDPVDYAAALYQSIRPKFITSDTAPGSK